MSEERIPRLNSSGCTNPTVHEIVKRERSGTCPQEHASKHVRPAYATNSDTQFLEFKRARPNIIQTNPPRASNLLPPEDCEQVRGFAANQTGNYPADIL